MNSKISPRLIDHLVLPVEDINVARERYTELGFTVAPDGVHPFGTENCCIFFKDDTFLEPLGVAQRETCEAEALKGTTMIADYMDYRFRRGLEGFSHTVLKSNSAKDDHKFFKREGISSGKRVKFSRNFDLPSGESGTVSFKLAFAADSRSPDSKFFTCQVVNAPNVDRSALKAHENGVLGLKEVILSEVNPTDFQYFFQTFLNQREMDVDSFGMSFHTGNALVTVLSPDGMEAFYGMSAEKRERGMQHLAFVLSVESLEATKKLFEKNGVDFSMRGSKILVPPATGQGTTIMFEETE